MGFRTNKYISDYKNGAKYINNSRYRYISGKSKLEYSSNLLNSQNYIITKKLSNNLFYKGFFYLFKVLDIPYNLFKKLAYFSIVIVILSIITEGLFLLFLYGIIILFINLNMIFKLILFGIFIGLLYFLYLYTFFSSMKEGIKKDKYNTSKYIIFMKKTFNIIEYFFIPLFKINSYFSNKKKFVILKNPNYNFENLKLDSGYLYNNSIFINFSTNFIKSRYNYLFEFILKYLIYILPIVYLLILYGIFSSNFNYIEVYFYTTMLFIISMIILIFKKYEK